MNVITISDVECWVCLSKDNMTVHHALPLHLNPRKNVLVPICRKCHDSLNSTDVQGMVKLAYSLCKSSQKQVQATRVLTRYFEEYSKRKGVEGEK